jgi:hypothetical protein
MALPKNILRQKKNYESSNISPCKNIIFKQPFKQNQNPSRYYNSIVTKKEGAQFNRIPWQDTDPHGAQISEVPKLNHGP